MNETDFLKLAITSEKDYNMTFFDWQKKINGIDNSNMRKIDNAVKALDERLADLEYMPMEILEFFIQPTIAEIGSIVTEIQMNYRLNKEPISLKLDNIEQGSPSEQGELRLTSLNIASNKVFKLEATDERNKTASKTATISFQNGAYYGVGNPEIADNAFILGLTKVLTGTKARTFTVNAGVGEYIWYAFPNRFGTPTFTVGGFSGGFSLIRTIDFINASDYTESYLVYRSDNASLGNTKVSVT